MADNGLLGPATGTVGPIPLDFWHWLLAQGGGLFSSAGNAASKVGQGLMSDPTPPNPEYGNPGQVVGPAFNFLVSQPLQAAGQGLTDWSQGFAPIQSTGNPTQPLVNRQQLMDIGGGLAMAAPFARAVPGAIADAGRDFAAASGMGMGVMPLKRPPLFQASSDPLEALAAQQAAVDADRAARNPTGNRPPLLQGGQDPLEGLAAQQAAADAARASQGGLLANNASGESAASLEAINRGTRNLVRVDADGNASPVLRDVTQVDARAPKGNLLVDANTGEIVDRGGMNQREANGLLARYQAKASANTSASLMDSPPPPERPRGGLLGEPLPGMPNVVTLKNGQKVNVGPLPAAQEAAAEYSLDSGIPYVRREEAAQVNEDLGKRTAAAYDALKHDPTNPDVKSAYDDLVKETLAQYQAMKRAGVKVELWHPDMKDSPYAEQGPRGALEDLRNNNHLWVFPTERGFGGSAEEAAAAADHPLNQLTKEVDANGRPMYANDVFRAVHDFFGHAKEGNGFRAAGEYNAFLEHSGMYSPNARRAMATETHGQNSWVNFGPDAAANQGASEVGTRYAPQKAGLLSDDLIEESRNPGSAPQVPSSGDTSFNPEELEAQSRQAQTVRNPQRNAFPGIYDNPHSIVQDVPVAPEDPILRQLFGVTRQDLSDAALAREGNLPGTLPGAAAKPKGSKAADAVMTPQNTQRLVDLLQEARNRPELFHGMTGWYNMDPLYAKFVQEFGKDAAPAAYSRFNTLMGMASPGSDVLTEINRGTAAHMMAQKGLFDDFVKYGGQAEDRRGRKFPSLLENVIGHPYHSTAQAIPMQRYLESGELQMQSPKVPMYIQASGVPETGFQTRTPVGDAHWSRGVGLADVRTAKHFAGSVTNPEMSQLAPWYRDQVAAQAGLQAVPAQALQWGALGQKTGVATAVGAPKLELFAQQVRKAAERAGVTPEEMLRRIIRGGAHAGAVGGAALGGGLLASQPSGGT